MKSKFILTLCLITICVLILSSVSFTKSIFVGSIQKPGAEVSESFFTSIPVSEEVNVTVEAYAFKREEVPNGNNWDYLITEIEISINGTSYTLTPPVGPGFVSHDFSVSPINDEIKIKFYITATSHSIGAEVSDDAGDYECQIEITTTKSG